jgi:hypothetical protein
VVLRGFSALSYHRLEGLGFVTATFPRPAFFHLFTNVLVGVFSDVCSSHQGGEEAKRPRQ